MALKWVGAMLVVAGAGGLGLWMAGRWKERLRLLEALRKLVYLLKGEILYANAPLAEAFQRAGKKGGGVFGSLFAAMAHRMEKQQGEPFYGMWKEEVDKLDPGLPLSKEDRRELAAMGEHLGYLDRDMQERTMLLYLEQLDLAIAYLREHQREKSRLCASLGIMGGLFLAIVLC